MPFLIQKSGGTERGIEMYEKVNPMHPDKVADRIAGAIVDLAYTKQENPKVAVEVLIGHGKCFIETESSVDFGKEEIDTIVNRISPTKMEVTAILGKQDAHLAGNQAKEVRCGDNGIFKGMPLTYEQKALINTAKSIYSYFPYDGKYIINDKKYVICQSNATDENLNPFRVNLGVDNVKVNPLGYWTGGTDVDTGATNRKLGSDMGDSVTGGGLHGKDLSKADVSVNIYAFLKAQQTGMPVELCCAIGDDTIDGKPYAEIVNIAREYIDRVGGFEKFAEWGLLDGHDYGIKIN